MMNKPRQSKLTRALNFFGDTLGSGVSKVGRGASDAIASRLYGSGLEEANTEARRVEERALQRARAARLAGNTDQAKKLIKIAQPNSQADIESTLASSDSGKFATNREILTGAAQTGLAAVTAPLAVSKSVVSGLAAGTGLGAIGAGSDRFAEGGNAKQVLGSALGGAALGGVLGGLGSGALKLASRKPRIKAVAASGFDAALPQKAFPAASITQLTPTRMPQSVTQSGQQMRSFARRAAEGVGDLPDEVRKGIKGSPDAYYTRQTLASVQEEGRKRLNEGSDLLTASLGDGKGIKDAAGISALIDRARLSASKGDYASSQADLLEVAGSLTAAGREVNAAKLLRFVSPEGMQLYGAKLADRFNVPPQARAKLAAEIGGLSQGATLDADDITKQQIKKSIEQAISRASGPNLVGKALNLRKAGMLTAPTTTIKNIVGNTINSTAEMSKDAVAAGFDKVLALRTGERAKSFTTAGGGRGLVKGLKDATTVLKTGIDPNQLSKYNDVSELPVAFSGRIANIYTEAVFRSLGAQDKIPYGIRYVNSLEEQARVAAKNAKISKSDFKSFVSDFVNNPSESVQATAAADAARAVFADSNALRKALGSIKFRAASEGGAVGKIISDTVLPFTGVPASVTNQAFAYSPVGLINGAKDAFKVMAAGVPNQALQRQAADELARGVMGTAVIAAGADMARRGLITGEPRDSREAELWKASGKQSNSVKIGNKWVRIDTVSPQVSALWIGARIAEKQASGEESNIADIPLYALRTTLNQSPLQGVQGGLDAISNPETSLQNEVNRAAGSLVPSIVGRTARAMDTNDEGLTLSRDVRGVRDAISQSIPGLRENLAPKFNVLGGQVTQGTSRQQLLDPFSLRDVGPRNDKNKALAEELLRLSAVDPTVSPTKEERTLTLENKDKVKLSSGQYAALQRDIGESNAATLNQILSDPEYQSLTDEEKVSVLKAASTDAKAAARLKIKRSSDFSATGDNNVPSPTRKDDQRLAITRTNQGKVTTKLEAIDKIDKLSESLRDIEETAKLKKDVSGESYGNEFTEWEKRAKELFNTRYFYMKSLDPVRDAEKIADLERQNTRILLSFRKYNDYGRVFRKSDAVNKKTKKSTSRSRAAIKVRVS